jgi:hypothetical protein
MIEWIQVDDSSRIIAAAFDAANEFILVRFPGDVEWCYEACPPHVWEEFIDPGTSKGKFIHDVLNGQPNHRYEA